MTFRKTVFAKAFDLAEAMFGKVAVIAASGHAVDELVAEQVHIAGVAEGGHGAAKPVGLVWSEFRGRDRDLHRLFLEQRHAERCFENVFQFVSRAVLWSRGGIML